MAAWLDAHVQVLRTTYAASETRDVPPFKFERGGKQLQCSQVALACEPRVKSDVVYECFEPSDFSRRCVK